MSNSVKVIILSVGVALFLFLALVGGIVFSFFMATGHSVDPLGPPETVAPIAPVPAANAAPETNAAPASTTLARMVQVQTSLTRAQEALQKASIKNHGGFVQQARQSVKEAQDHCTAAIQFLAEHADEKMPINGTTGVRAAEIPGYDVKGPDSYGSPNLAHAILALNEALAALTQEGSSKLAVPEMDGRRDRMIEAIGETNRLILEAYATAHKGDAAAQTAPATQGG